MDRRSFTHALLGGVAASVASCIAPGADRRAPPVGGRALRQREVASVAAVRRALEGAGFPVRRPFPTSLLPQMDPFVMLDEMGPVRWAPGEARGAPDHPHRGFETVTYLLSGRMQHRDSLGNRGALNPGDVQWMTAGRGIVHSEMPHDDLVRDGGDTHGFQLWVNLPASAKMSPPRYQEPGSHDLPRAGTDDGRATAKVIAGEALGVRAVIATHTPMTYHHWTLRPGARIDQRLPADHNVGVYVFRGACLLGEARRVVRDGEFATLGPGDALRMAVGRDDTAELLLLAGMPLREPVARGGPFVMNTDEEVRQAFADYRAGRMGRIPG